VDTGRIRICWEYKVPGWETQGRTEDGGSESNRSGSETADMGGVGCGTTMVQGNFHPGNGWSYLGSVGAQRAALPGANSGWGNGGCLAFSTGGGPKP